MTMKAQKGQWQPLMKPAFLNDIAKLHAKELQQVMEKITMLTHDPFADGKVKKQLTHHPGKPYRIRAGAYRILYTFNQQFISLFGLERRDEKTYKDDIVTAELPDANLLNELDLPEEAAPAQVMQHYWEQTFAQPQSRQLPEQITVELLRKLQVSEAYHTRLLRISDEDGLFDCPGIDESTVVRLHDYMFSRPLIEVMQQPDLILGNVDDLLRYKDGELLAFLLKLSPEQERYASWSLHTTGPTLVKGGPGTGKSTVALYRIRSLLEQTLKTGKGTPHILFTTYTNALVRSSQQLLQQLLGPDAGYVRVDTADSIAYTILNSCGQVRDYTLLDDGRELQKLTRQAIAETTFSGNLLQKQAQRQTIERMGVDYLLQELNGVIVARQLRSLEEYQRTSRNGRKLGLNATQRAAVWAIYEEWQRLLRAAKKETWQQRRARAEALVTESSLYQYYDAVVIDEAQDLDPSALRMLIQLCKSANRIFITADANQSIYGSGFAWSDVHESLKFQGRTSILHANYRSTAEVGEAAQSYLTYGGALEADGIERQYVNNGPLPDARTVLNNQHEVQLLANYFKKASRSLRLTLGSCAVLCPTDYAGKTLAAALTEQGIEATYMNGHDLNLTRAGIKIITLKSSKGLEFPIVALAGFTLSNYPVFPQEATDEEEAELLARERRTMFVGMTRAMRALLVVLPHASANPLLQGFDAGCWNFTRNI